MSTIITSPSQYIQALPEDRQAVITKLNETIIENLPDGFEAQMIYGMIGYVVPHELYPAGYHCDPKLPLPFMSIASQKNFVAVYHMGIYAGETLMNWFLSEYPKHCKSKLDMGKSCIRFKKIEEIPYQLIALLASKMTAQSWIIMYESIYKNKK